MIVQIPLQPFPSQQIVVTVGGQNVTIVTRQLGGRQYFSASTSGLVLCRNVLFVDRTFLIQAPYLGFSGDFMSVDTQGNEMPVFSQWGSRFWLVYANE